jgi:hypothetical protein
MGLPLAPRRLFVDAIMEVTAYAYTNQYVFAYTPCSGSTSGLCRECNVFGQLGMPCNDCYLSSGCPLATCDVCGNTGPKGVVCFSCGAHYGDAYAYTQRYDFAYTPCSGPIPGVCRECGDVGQLGRPCNNCYSSSGNPLGPCGVCDVIGPVGVACCDCGDVYGPPPDILIGPHANN